MNFNFNSLKSVANTVGMFCKDHAPEILVGVGIVGSATATVIACKETLKAPEIIKAHKENLQTIKEAKEIAEQNHGRIPSIDEKTQEPTEITYTEKDYKKDVAMCYAHTAKEFVKLYWKPVLLGGASAASICAGTGILRTRWANTMVAYAALDSADKKLQENIVKKYGKEELTKLQHGLIEKEITVEETDEDGKTKKVKKKVLVGEKPEKHTDYSRLFDMGNPNWKPGNGEYNMMWLMGMQQYFNDLLHTKGILSLNEVYDALGFEQCKEGVMTGWTFGDNASDNGDGYVQLTIAEVHYDDKEERNYTPNNPRLLIDFNVDGMIFDNYKKKKDTDKPIKEVVYAN